MAPRLERSNAAATRTATAMTPRRGGNTSMGLFHSARVNRSSRKSKSKSDRKKKEASEVVSHVHSLGTGSWGSVAENTTGSSSSLRSSGSTEDTVSTSSFSASSSRVYDFHRACSLKALNDDTAILRDDDGWSEASVQAVVRCWKLSAAQSAKLKELGERLRDCGADNDNDNDDSSKNHYWQKNNNTADQVVRFLHDSNYNVKSAETMFRNMLAWKKKMGVHDILRKWETFPQEAFENIPGAILRDAVDTEGDLVMVDVCSKADTLGIIHRYGVKTIVHHAIATREIMTRILHQQHQKRLSSASSSSSSASRSINNSSGGSGRILLISDMSGLSRRHVHAKVLAAFGQVARVDQDNYPGAAKRIIVIHANAMYRIVWSLVKHFLEPHVAAMITVCDEQNYRQVLQQHVGDDYWKILPAAILPEGEGTNDAPPVMEGMNPYWTGGPLPPPPVPQDE